MGGYFSALSPGSIPHLILTALKKIRGNKGTYKVKTKLSEIFWCLITRLTQLKAPKSEEQRNKKKLHNSLNWPIWEGTIHTNTENNHVWHEMQNLDYEHHDKKLILYKNKPTQWAWLRQSCWSFTGGHPNLLLVQARIKNTSSHFGVL
jgi:hypothetical protein